MRRRSMCRFAFLVIILISRPLWAGWQAGGIAVADVTNTEQNCRLVSDGAGGAIIVWRDHYSYQDNPDIYAQRVDKDGNLLWSGYGVAVCAASGGQYEPRIVPDGAGGAIVAWVDFRDSIGQIWAQRIDASGSCLWAPNGIWVCAVPNTWGWWKDFDLRMIPCPGGAILSWTDDRTGDWNVYAQRIDLNGAHLWTPNGITVCATAGTQTGSRLTSDGAGGAIVAWIDGVLYSESEDIYAQRIAADSTPLWTQGGVNICSAPGAQYWMDIVSDSISGAYIAWMDERTDTFDIYMQKIDSSGATSWQADGISVCTARNEQWRPKLAADLSGGVYVTWYDRRRATAGLASEDKPGVRMLGPNDGWHDGGTYAQRFDAEGNALWIENGIMIRDDQYLDDQHQAIVADGYNGVIISWVAVCAPAALSPAAARASGSAELYGVFTQRVAPNGTCFWGEGGVTIGGEGTYPELITDGAAGAIVVWAQYSCGRVPQGIYAQRVSGNGIAPPTDAERSPVATFLAQNYPNPFNPATSIVFTMLVAGSVSLRILDVTGRLVRVVREGRLGAGRHEESWDGRDLNGTLVASGVYFYQLTAEGHSLTKKMVLLR